MMARVGAEDDESFTFESAVRGHHVFKRIWTPVNGQLLQVRAETGNERDPYAVATVHDDTIVGHHMCLAKFQEQRSTFFSMVDGCDLYSAKIGTFGA